MSAGEGKFEILLDHLRLARGFDLTGYKRPSLERRVQKRVQMVGLNDFGDYIDYLEVHPDEHVKLFNHILINVTGFFRDQASWDHLSKDVVPRIIAGKKTDAPIRVWSAGCATGEEACTLAMIFAEALGPEAFRERVKIYASDVDQDALLVARQATYGPREIEAVPPKLRKTYFKKIDDRYVFHNDFRRSLIFGRHDLVQDAPISRLDLLVCRNALMYFNAETQSRILIRFHFALNDPGYMFLGKAEMMLSQSHLFKPLEMKHRIFIKLAHASTRDRLQLMAQARGPESGMQMSRQIRLRDLAVDASAYAHLIINAKGALMTANQCAMSVLQILPRDLGRPFGELEVSHRPVELRPAIDRAMRDKRGVHLESIERRRADGSGDPQRFDVHVVPLIEDDGTTAGTSITFIDVTTLYAAREELLRARQELETAFEEQQSTSEEMETTNEELQSTNEELETANEELQSTNEELETMNEEMQSSNEELQTVNDELRQRTDEIHRSNSFLMSILSSVKAAVVVVDRSLSVLIWNRRAEELWGLRAEETRGKPFLSLDIGFPVDKLAKPLRSVLGGNGAEPMIQESVNRRGKTFQCRVRFSPLVAKDKQQREGAIMMMDDEWA